MSIKCPICTNPVQLAHLSDAGTCMYCADSLRDLRRAHAKAAALIQTQQDEAWEKVDERFLELRAASAQRAADKRKQEELAKKRRALTSANREQASIALARRSLLHYVERYIPSYDSSWAHEDVARRIERFVAAVDRGESPRLILQVCSRFGKSLLASDAGPAWILGNHPDWKIVIASYSDELPTAFSKNIRTQLRSPDYQEVFPKGPKISADDSGAKAWTTVQGGGLRATGVGGGLLGFGAHVIIVDDPIKDMSEADSPGQLEKVYDWFSSVAYSRLMPGGGILVIQQRMAHEDLVGRLETRMLEEEANILDMRSDAEALRSKDNVSTDDERDAKFQEDAADELHESIDRWDIATYPALATHDEYLEPKGNIVRVQPTMEAKGDWRLLRRAGEAIHPKRYGRPYYLKLKRANPRRFAAMYQLTPQVDDGEYFSKDSFNRYKPKKYPNLETCNIFAAWDLAIGTKQSNDHTVGIAGCMDPKGQLWLLERIRGKFGDIRETSDMIIDMHTKWNCSQTGIERTHVEMAMGPILKSRMRERNLYVNLAEGKEALKPISDKRVRARPLQNLCQSNKVYVPEGEDWDDYISLMTRFGSTTVDDDVDATAWLAILATRHAPPRDPAEERKNKKPDSWLDDYIAEVMGGDDDGFMSS